MVILYDNSQAVPHAEKRKAGWSSHSELIIWKKNIVSKFMTVMSLNQFFVLTEEGARIISN